MGNGFLDRSATNYGISRRVPAFTGRPRAAPAFYFTLRFNAGKSDGCYPELGLADGTEDHSQRGGRRPKGVMPTGAPVRCQL